MSVSWQNRRWGNIISIPNICTCCSGFLIFDTESSFGNFKFTSRKKYVHYTWWPMKDNFLHTGCECTEITSVSSFSRSYCYSARLLASSCRPSVCPSVMLCVVALIDVQSKKLHQRVPSRQFLFLQTLLLYDVGSFSHKTHRKKWVEETVNVTFWDTENHTCTGLLRIWYCWELEQIDVVNFARHRHPSVDWVCVRS